ncbi:MAG: DUF2288 domain-containing protein [Gammaproteobacteria bacterium]|nr:MAG: DUF2288 domain-containing protein [Gammaproteobacteria bacterium]
MNDNTLTSELLLETAQIPWRELQRFFASGNAISVDDSLDLIHVATQISNDNATQVKAWMEAGLVDAVKDSQAQTWFEQDVMLWALVIKPWVLVQYKK